MVHVQAKTFWAWPSSEEYSEIKPIEDRYDVSVVKHFFTLFLASWHQPSRPVSDSSMKNAKTQIAPPRENLLTQTHCAQGALSRGSLI